MPLLSRALDVSAALLVLTAIGIGSVGMDRRIDLRTNLALHVLPGDSQSSDMRAVVVMQAEDCESLLGGLSALRGKSSSSLSLTGIAVTGRSSDSTIVRSALRETVDSLTPVHAIGARAERQLRGLGYTSTPLLLVFDQQQRLRYASPLARDDMELRQLRKALMAIASETAQGGVDARP